MADVVSDIIRMIINTVTSNNWLPAVTNYPPNSCETVRHHIAVFLISDASGWSCVRRSLDMLLSSKPGAFGGALSWLTAYCVPVPFPTVLCCQSPNMLSP